MEDGTTASRSQCFTMTFIQSWLQGRYEKKAECSLWPTTWYFCFALPREYLSLYLPTVLLKYFFQQSYLFLDLITFLTVCYASNTTRIQRLHSNCKIHWNILPNIERFTNNYVIQCGLVYKFNVQNFDMWLKWSFSYWMRTVHFVS